MLPIHNITDITEPFIQNDQLSNAFSAEEAETYKKTLLQFQEYLQKGNSSMAHEALIRLIYTPNFLPFEGIENYRQHLTYINLTCHLTVLNTNVHPAPCMKLYLALQKRIDILQTQDTFLNLAKDICHKYCLLVKNYAFSNYSKNIRSAINYIELHLDEDLSLAKLAEILNKNASALSAAFTKEVGVGITHYIHQTRIDRALFYFNTTKMSVSEVSLAVGIQDFAYFSKLFRKQVGCSPREYCKQLN